MSDGTNSKPWQRFLTELGKEGVAFPAIQHADESTRSQLLQSLTTLSNIDRAQVSSTWAKLAANVKSEVDTTQALKDHFQASEQRQLEPWRLALQRTQARHKRYMGESRESLQAAFIDLSKNHALTPTEVLIGQYALFSADPESGLKALGAMLVRELPVQRMSAHNTLVATANGEEFLCAIGPYLERLEHPLFPPDVRFSALNQAILRACSSEPHVGLTVSGGASDRRTGIAADANPLYRRAVSGQRNDPFAPPGHADGPSGAGSLPVISDGNGGWGVDVTQLEHAFDTVWNQLAAVTEAVKKLHEAKSTGEIKTLADAITARLEETKQGFGRARGATFRGRGGRGRAGNRGRNF